MAPARFDDLDLAVLETRKGEKWHTYPRDILPAWVAEMDFPVAEPIERVLHSGIGEDLLLYGLAWGTPLSVEVDEYEPGRVTGLSQGAATWTCRTYLDASELEFRKRATLRSYDQTADLYRSSLNVTMSGSWRFV